MRYRIGISIFNLLSSVLNQIITDMRGLNPETGLLWTSEEIDNQLILLAAITPAISGYTIYVGDNGRTSASDAAVVTLIINSNDIIEPYIYPFTITIDTTKAGSASNTFVLPLKTGLTYNFNVDWGDDSDEDVIGSTLTEKTKVYTSSGIYQIKITGIFPAIIFGNAGDKLKLISIDAWGAIELEVVQAAFWGCSNLVANYSDVPNTTNASSFSYMFTNCSLFNGAIAFDSSNGTVFTNMFSGCFNFNQSLANMNTEKGTNFSYMLYNAIKFKQPLSALNVELGTNMSNMCGGTFDMNAPGATTNYDATLVAWELQNLSDGQTISFGASEYSSVGETAKNAIIADDGWAFTDGGLAS